MQRSVIRIITTVIFVGLLAAPIVIKRVSSGTSSSGTLSEEAALERYGFALREVSQDAGIDFTHQPPQLDAKLDHIMPEVAAMGAAVSVTDYNNDGLQDLYITNSAYGTQNALFENQGDGTFEDVAADLGVADVNRQGTGTSMGAVWGDFDNDGYEDLFLYKWGRPELYRNDQGDGFTRVTDQASFPEWLNANTAVWFDYDRDGLLDLFIGGFYKKDLNLWELETTRMMPESYEYATNGGRNFLFRNLGDGRFEEVGKAMGLAESTRWSLAASATDFNRDGYPDLFIANDFGVDELYLNEGGTRFRDVGRASNISRTPKSGMNATTADVLNRSQWSIYVSNISESGLLIQGNTLWTPRMDPGEDPTFRNLADALGIELAGWSYGAQFGDLNNDGWLDLFVTNGYISGDKEESYWYDFSKVAGGHEGIIADAANWPAMEGRSHSGHQANRVWMNDGAGRFQDVGNAVGGVNTLDGRAVALADLWNRGTLDVIVAHQRGPLSVYRNTVRPEHHWIGFKLEGTQSNRSAIGAEVELFWADQQQMQRVDGGSGFSAQNQRPLHFGLGTTAQVERAVIRWPSGEEQTLTDLAVDTTHTVQEPR
jgi:hypothetical protein